MQSSDALLFLLDSDDKVVIARSEKRQAPNKQWERYHRSDILKAVRCASALLKPFQHGGLSLLLRR